MRRGQDHVEGGRLVVGEIQLASGSDVRFNAYAATDNSCDRCIRAVQNDRAVCSFMIKVCGVDWFVDPCEFSPAALCECATGCDSGGAISKSGS